MAKPTGSKGRGRNRNNSGKRSPGRGGNYDPNGGRNRGNAQQLMDKYLALARDASSQGDRIAAENYFQHADHYYRVVFTRNEQQQEARRRSSQNAPQNAPQEGSNDPLPVQAVDSNANPVGIGKDQGNAAENDSSPKVNGGDNGAKADSPASPEPVTAEDTPAAKPKRARAPRKPKETKSAPEAAE